MTRLLCTVGILGGLSRSDAAESWWRVSGKVEEGADPLGWFYLASNCSGKWNHLKPLETCRVDPVQL
jgi:hypothetical protein